MDAAILSLILGIISLALTLSGILSLVTSIPGIIIALVSLKSTKIGHPIYFFGKGRVEQKLVNLKAFDKIRNLLYLAIFLNMLSILALISFYFYFYLSSRFT